MSISALKTFRHWAGLIASVATVLFVTLYPHGPSATNNGGNAYRTAILDQRTVDLAGERMGDAVTAALVGSDAADRR